jgi:phosphopantothenoylcysteine decarboxylase/phosphopantothenate--cysteine ligase
MPGPLAEKIVLLGVTGGIAAFRAVELVRLFQKEGAKVRVVMTPNATRFVGPLTFSALSGERVLLDLFDQPREADMDHIRWVQEANLLVVAPATANSLAKFSLGLADDALSTLFLAMNGPRLVCPAMNTRMWQNPAVQENLKRLAQRGVGVVAPGEGELACGEEGPGRLAELEDILEAAKTKLSPQDLSGIRMLITAGPTQESLDPVRFLSNHSSGKMGFALARVAARRGAQVTLVSGPTHLTPPPPVHWVPVVTALEMHRAALEAFKEAQVVIKAAAVSDYRPSEHAGRKMKRAIDRMTLSLVANPDILKEMGKKKGKRFLVGFAAETEDLIQNARQKMKSKNLDLIVANPVGVPDAGFMADTNRIKILSRDEKVREYPLMSKEEAAEIICNQILAHLGRR